MDILVGIISGLIIVALGYFGYKKNLNNKLKDLKHDESLVKKALDDLDKGLQKIKENQKGKTPNEVEDHWNNN